LAPGDKTDERLCRSAPNLTARRGWRGSALQRLALACFSLPLAARWSALRLHAANSARSISSMSQSDFDWEYYLLSACSLALVIGCLFILLVAM